MTDPLNPLDSNELFTEVPKTLSDYMGEGKKYSDENAVAKALQEKDLFIEKLKTENGELRIDLTSRTSLEELLTTANTQGPPPVPPEELQQTPPSLPAPSDPTPPANLEEEVLKLLQQEKAKDSRENNIQMVRKALTERFGDNYNSTLERVASTLSISKKFLADMAATTPNGLLKLIDTVVPKGDQTFTPPPSVIETGYGLPNPAIHDKGYYDNLRRTDLKAYLSKGVQQEMHDQAMRLGSAFFTA